jgi:hypothetical protein
MDEEIEDEIVEIKLPGNQVLDVRDPAATVRLGMPRSVSLKALRAPFEWCCENCKSPWSTSLDEAACERVYLFADEREAFWFKTRFYDPTACRFQ